MPFHVRNRRRTLASLEREFPCAEVLDVTSRGPKPWVEFSPFFPHGDIPVPFSKGVVSQSVEGIWQGLKVFENEDVDPRKFAVANMKGLKRSIRRHGPIRGHRAGVKGQRILSHAEARREIFLPAYRWVLENRLGGLVDELRELSAARDVVLVDYATNADLDNLDKPLPHASLVVQYVEGRWPK
jgi:hypothetical protein